jgi:hypothetical protein
LPVILMSAAEHPRNLKGASSREDLGSLHSHHECWGLVKELAEGDHRWQFVSGCSGPRRWNEAFGPRTGKWSWKKVTVILEFAGCDRPAERRHSHRGSPNPSLPGSV